MDSKNVTQEAPAAQAEPAAPLATKPKIFILVNGGSSDMLMMAAMSEDGHSLAGHCSSSIGWGKHDMGIGSDWKHEDYNAHYPQGWDLEFVEDPRNHAGLMAAVALYNARHEALAKAEGSAA